MRVASMVPSWTETLIEAGADVVARTRFCIHPSDGVSRIAAVGGTKDIAWEKLASAAADLLVLDREENPLAMAEKSPLPYWASHVQSVDDMAPALRGLAKIFSDAGDTSVASALDSYAKRWETVISQLRSRSSPAFVLPALRKWLRQPQAHAFEPSVTTFFEKTLYLIWKNPYMAAGHDTFIGSMLELLGLKLEKFVTKYPEIDLADYDPAKTLLLFSSEPYPFEKYRDELAQLPFASAIVDGESLSWFGLRSLQFLESC